MSGFACHDIDRLAEPRSHLVGRVDVVRRRYDVGDPQPELLVEPSSQTAAYQSALKSGANLVQSSLMDFLR